VPGPGIGVPAAASLTGLPESHARAALEALEGVSLLDRHPHDRYAMHDLIRAYAAATTVHELTSGLRQAALRRALDFYVHTAHTADRLLDPHRRQPVQLGSPALGVCHQRLPDVPAAMAWAGAEHAALLAAQRSATEHAWHLTAWQLAWTLTTFHNWRGRRHDQLAVWRAALDAAAHLPDATFRINAHRYLGCAYTDLGRHEKGIEQLHEALALAEEQRNPDLQAHTHRGLAWAFGRCGNDQQALEHATHAWHLCRTRDQPVGEADALTAMGWYSARIGEYGTARAHCHAALGLHRCHHNPEGQAEALDALGYAEHRSGEHQQAIGYYQQALAQYRALGNTSDTATGLDNLSDPHVALGQHEHARKTWQEALKLYRQQDRKTDADRVQQQLAALDRQPEAR